MKISDKIINLRKKEGWSQETLAYKLDVSRQAVSKWESGVSVPDIEKIVSMCELFGISTDVLLKNDIDKSPSASSEISKSRSVEDKEVVAYLDAVKKYSKFVSFATFLCILSPICLLILGALSEIKSSGISESLAVGGGMSVLIVLVGIAVALFIPCGIALSKYEYLSQEKIILSKDMKNNLLNQREKTDKYYTSYISIGVVLCIISLLPLFISAIFETHDIVYVICVCVMLIITGVGVSLIIVASYKNSSIKKLLQLDEFLPENKSKNKFNELFSSAYWLIAVAVYLLWSFLSNNWQISWLVWPIASLVFAAYKAILYGIRNIKQK